MTPFIIVGGILAALGIAALLTVVVRALPRLARLPKAPTPNREFSLKERILFERMMRRLQGAGSQISHRVATTFRGWEAHLDRGYRRLRLLAQEYVPTRPAAKEEACRTYIASAEVAATSGEFTEAEERYLACLKINPKHRDAYLGLASLYRKRKEGGLAEETLRFLRKLYPDDHEVLAVLAMVLQEQGQGSAALKEIQAAIALAPRNPRYLDFATDLAIMEQNRRLAAELLSQLRAANPENQKLAEFEERIATLGSK